MVAFEWSELASQSRSEGALYLEFLKVPAMSAGFYRLAAGATDPQHPHGEDEIYYIVAGRGHIRVEGEDRPVVPGTVVYVPARHEHRFHHIQEDLEILVFFAPAEGTTTAQPE
jgi:mannose-6-phosphate isomerase-like protein (cupin superfamily)